ncbi:hypothetical protein RIF29_17643 [Crotalaria pallida]|uniref:Uncharacterized protein n=1 Tax=Crotalaria pallida TaxID=3830 RepID=A0AAN9ID57_CROPI
MPLAPLLVGPILCVPHLISSPFVVLFLFLCCYGYSHSIHISLDFFLEARRNSRKVLKPCLSTQIKFKLL